MRCLPLRWEYTGERELKGRGMGPPAISLTEQNAAAQTLPRHANFRWCRGSYPVLARPFNAI